MKKLLILLTVIFIILSVPAKATAGVIISPAIHDLESGETYQLKIRNNENQQVTFEIKPWLFDEQDNRVIPLSQAKMDTLFAPLIEISTNEITVDAGTEEEINISFKTEDLNPSYINGVSISSKTGEGQLAINFVGSSIFLNRGDKQTESMSLTASTHPKFILNNHIKVTYGLQNTGEYISKLSGEIKITDKEGTLLTTIPITPDINTNLKRNKSIEKEFNYKLPVDGLFDELITKYKINLQVTSNTGNSYQADTEVYYINPLIPIGSIAIILLITLILLSSRRKTKTINEAPERERA